MTFCMILPILRIFSMERNIFKDHYNKYQWKKWCFGSRSCYCYTELNIDRSCTWGMLHISFHCLSCPGSCVNLQLQNWRLELPFISFNNHTTSSNIHIDQCVEIIKWKWNVLSHDSALVRLYWPWDNLDYWGEFCYEACPWCRIDPSTCWPAVHYHCTTDTHRLKYWRFIASLLSPTTTMHH